MGAEKLIIEITGWLGSGFILVAYYLISTNRILGGSVKYQVLNILGAIFLMINTFYNQSYPSVGLNAIWLIIGAMAIVKSISKTNSKK